MSHRRHQPARQTAADVAPAQVTLAETGSTLIYPVFQIWAAEYPKTHPGVTVTAAATGSGAGVEQAISGAAQIGAFDAYMSDAQVRDNPLIINVPMAISAQTVNYNLPDLNGQNLKLDGRTLAGIYSGKIRSWDDPAIAAMNGGVKLPHNAIVPVPSREGPPNRKPSPVQNPSSGCTRWLIFKIIFSGWSSC